jgi:hypothetical protein
LSGFRHKIIPVPEWGGVKVLIREISAPAWSLWQAELAKKEKAKEGDDTTALGDPPQPVEPEVNNRAEAMLFSHALLNLDGTRVFDDDDIDTLTVVYGPVHTRLLNAAIRLGGQHVDSAVDAEKK